MRNDFLSLHQFEPVAASIDSLLVSTYSPHAADIAAPYAASRLISDSLAGRMLDQFGGRTAHLALGASSMYATWDDHWCHDVLTFYNYPVHYGIILTDRVFMNPWTDLNSTGVTKWVAFDWWQWLRRRVPEPRQTDALMFLCQASEVYTASPERGYAGIPEQVLSAMQREGNRLFGQLEREFSEHLLQVWGTPLLPNLP